MMKASEYALCGCLLDVAAADLTSFINHPAVDMLEWRLDAFLLRHSLDEAREILVKAMGSSARHPFLVTNRPVREGGAFEGPEDLRLELLREAAVAGADWIDIESDVRESELEWLRREKVKFVLSHHDFSGTPERSELERQVRGMAQKGATVLKIVTFARSPEENLRVLDLIPYGRRELGVDVIAFCMGPFGRWSRLVCLLLGSPWTYVQLPGAGIAAPGQLMAEEMRTMLHMAVGQ